MAVSRATIAPGLQVLMETKRFGDSVRGSKLGYIDIYLRDKAATK